MPYDFGTMLTEFYARGQDYMNDAGAGVVRAKRWINDANHAINEMEPWGYLQKAVTAVHPVVVSDLGRIEAVTDVANLNPLVYIDRRDLIDTYGAIGTVTTVLPDYYYLTGGNTVTVYPWNTSVEISVRYYKVDADMVNNSDVPSMPDRFRPAIVDLAVSYARKDKSDYAEAQAAEQAAMAVVGRMAQWNQLLPGAAGFQMQYGGSEDD